MFVVKDNCPNCGACKNVCPTNAIKFDKKAVINKDECIQCGVCAKACPIGIIINEQDTTETVENKQPKKEE